MGIELNSEAEYDRIAPLDADMPRKSELSAPDEADIPLIPWLDEETARLVRAITATVARRHPDLRAVILYGSVARHEERPLDDEEPSDVDLLLLFDLEPGLGRLPFERRHAINESTGLALDCYLHAPREVQTLLAVDDLSEWDPTFVENVAHDGMLLWARGPLPEPLAPVERRTLGVRTALDAIRHARGL